MLFRRNKPDWAGEPDEDRPEKTGPARFWELIKYELATILIVNVLFVVTCIPVVTIPLALFSLHKIVRKIVLDKGVSCARDYFSAWRRDGKRAYGAFFLVAVPMAAAGYGCVFYLRRAAASPLLLLPFAFCVCVFVVATLASTYLYGLLCDGWPLRDAVKTALVLALAKPLRAILASLCEYGLPLLAILFFPYSGAYLLLLGFSLPCLLGHFYIRTVLRQYGRERQLP